MFFKTIAENKCATSFSPGWCPYQCHGVMPALCLRTDRVETWRLHSGSRGYFWRNICWIKSQIVACAFRFTSYRSVCLFVHVCEKRKRKDRWKWMSGKNKGCFMLAFTFLTVWKHEHRCLSSVPTYSELCLWLKAAALQLKPSDNCGKFMV